MDPTGTRFSTLIYLRICNGVRKTCLQLINAFMDPLMQHHFHDFFLHMSSIYSFFTLYSMFHSIEFFQRFHTFLTSVVNLVQCFHASILLTRTSRDLSEHETPPILIHDPEDFEIINNSKEEVEVKCNIVFSEGLYPHEIKKRIVYRQS